MSIKRARDGPTVTPEERRIDQAIEDTFPASDPPGTTGGITRINPATPVKGLGEPSGADNSGSTDRDKR
jgi:hypothetical protein